MCRVLLLLSGLALLPGMGLSSPTGHLLEEAVRAPHWSIGPLILLATFTSEDLACVAAGILASGGVLPFWYACLWCWTGILAGDIALYALGRISGDHATQMRFVRRFLTPRRLQQGRHLFEEYGLWMLFSARFLPGSRMPVYIAAGVLKVPLPKFALYLAFAGLLWTPAVVGLAHWWGQRMVEWLDLYEKYAWLAALLAAALAGISIRLVMPLFSARGRPLLLSRLYRILEWEFWPPSVFYLPLVPYLLGLAWRHRHPTAFTAANPAIPLGGLVEESKSAILDGLGRSASSRASIARWTLLPPASPEARLTALRRFQETLPEAFPLVLKPDVGERGHGVAIIRDMAQVSAYLQGCTEAIIAQEYVRGAEFGVFYYRWPGSAQGEILSITGKQLVSVTGNGHSNLEELILHHPRALRMARFFLRRHREQLEWIPAKGEIVPLGELGNHCRGALFTDARALRTEALRQVIDEISQGFPGFHFGRFDLRVPSKEDLKRGERIQILELNGVSAEATHIYQPGYPLLRAYRDLAEQWRIAYGIGALNHQAGVPLPPTREVLRLVWRHLRRRPWDAPGPDHREVSARAANSPAEPSAIPSRSTGSSAS